MKIDFWVYSRVVFCLQSCHRSNIILKYIHFDWNIKLVFFIAYFICSWWYLESNKTRFMFLWNFILTLFQSICSLKLSGNWDIDWSQTLFNFPYAETLALLPVISDSILSTVWCIFFQFFGIIIFLWIHHL